MTAVVEDFRTYFKSMTPNVKRYYWIVLISAISGSAFNVLLSIYLKQSGFAEHTVGSVLSLMTLGSALGAFPASIIASHINKKNTLILGMAFMMIMGFAMINISMLSIVLIAAFLVGLGQSAVMILQGPILYEHTAEEHRITAFSLAFVLQNTAFVLASYVIGKFSTLITPSLGAVGANALVLNASNGVLMLSIALSTGFSGKSMLSKQKQETLSAALQQTYMDFKSVLTGGALLYVIQVAFIGFGAGLVVPFFSMYLKFTLNISDATVGTIMAFSQVGTVIGGLSVAPLAKRFGRVNTVLACQLLSIPFLISISFPQGIILVALSFFFRSSLMNMASPIIGSLAMEIVPDDVRTHMSSVVAMTSNLFRALGIYVGGYLMHAVSYNFPYAITIVCYLIGTVILKKAFGKSAH